MPQTRRTPGAGQAPGGSSEVISATGASVTDLPELRMPIGWHEQTEHEGRWWYAEGYAAGYAAAEQAIANEITEALGARPMEPKKVIRWLVAGVGVARRGKPA